MHKIPSFGMSYLKNLEFITKLGILHIYPYIIHEEILDSTNPYFCPLVLTYKGTMKKIPIKNYTYLGHQAVKQIKQHSFYSKKWSSEILWWGLFNQRCQIDKGGNAHFQNLESHSLQLCININTFDFSNASHYYYTSSIERSILSSD